MKRSLLAGAAVAALLVAGTPKPARASWLSQALHAYFDPGYPGYGSGYYGYSPGYGYGYSGLGPVYPGYGYGGYYAPGYGPPTPRWSYSYGPGYHRPWYGRHEGHEWHEHDWHAHHEYRR